MKEVPVIDAFDKFKPESCVFVISVDKNGRPNGMVAGWNMKCSINPPLFAVALSKKGNTQRLIKESKEFAIAIPNKELENEVVYFGSVHGFDIDKFQESKIETVKAKYIQSPLIKNATVNFECKMVNEVDSGDHIIFIGNIVASYVKPDTKILFNIKKIDGKRIFEEM